MNILYAVSEAAPFVKTGGLADVAGSLPKALRAEGEDVRVILPLYSSIPSKWRDKMNFCFYTYVHLAWRRQYCGLFSLVADGVTFYFIDNEYYFKRDAVYGCYDDGERFGFFSRAVTEVLPLLGWKPDVINCNDWQTALIPIYLRLEKADYYTDIKTVFTIHNIEYQGRFGTSTAEDVFGLPSELYDSGIIRYDDDVNLMKGAIYKADHITTVSPSYAQELHHPYFGCGLHKIIEDNTYKLTGIVNGLDTSRYDPMSDPFLAVNYGACCLDGKAKCRADLCRELDLDENDSRPILAVISRLVGHKGFDIVKDALDGIVEKGLRFVVLGTGDGKYEDFFRWAESRYHGSVSASIMYSEARSSKIYAGADMLLMPSRSEPCGLSQLIAMRYGTIPIVHEVGGLRDTVHPYPREDSNGFSFFCYSYDALLGTIDYALSVWQNKAEWTKLMQRAMLEDLSWKRSANEYLNIYKALTESV